MKGIFRKLVSVLMIGAVSFCFFGCNSENNKTRKTKKTSESGESSYAIDSSFIDEVINSSQPAIEPAEPATRITRLNFVPATGYYKVNTNLHHCFYIDTEKYWYKYRGYTSFMVDNDYDYSLLYSQSALEFIKEVEAIPDNTTEADGPFALKIDMAYKDPDGTSHTIVKRVYGTLPDNWFAIVKLANDLTMQRMEIPTSREITVVDGEYLKQYHRIHEYHYPRGTSLDDIIKELGITYEYLYDETLLFQDDHLSVWELLDRYTFDHLNMKEYSYFETSPKEPSTPDELKEYAKKHLENITSENDVCVAGTVQKYGFQIVRSDCFEKWRKENGYDIGSPGYYNCVGYLAVTRDASGDETASVKYYECYIDPSHKFIIIVSNTTEGYSLRNYTVVYDFFHK